MGKSKRNNKELLINILVILVPIVLAAFISYFNIVKITKVSGKSMNSTLYDGQYILFTKFHKIQRNDVVVADSPDSWPSKDHYLIKRAVGMPGDSIEITKNTVRVNGEEVINFKGLLKDNDKPINFCLCDGNYFLVGDNIGHSYDSLTRYLDPNREGKNDWTFLQDSIMFGKNIENKNLGVDKINEE